MSRKHHDWRDGIKKGLRDERGVRIQKFRNCDKEGRDYRPMAGEEMTVLYNMAKHNMERSKEWRTRAGLKGIRYETADDLEKAIMGYWDYLIQANENQINLIPDVEGLCAFLGITRKTLMNWENNDVRGFASIIEQAKNDIAACKKQIGLQGKIPPIVMAMDFNNNHGYTQRQEVVVTPNNPLGDATSNEELLAKYEQYAELGDPNVPVALPAVKAKEE